MTPFIFLQLVLNRSSPNAAGPVISEWMVLTTLVCTKEWAAKNDRNLIVPIYMYEEMYK